MKIIYVWVVLLLVVIVGVGFFIYRIYTKPPQPVVDFAKTRANLAQEYENKAEVLSDSGLIIAEQLKAKQGSLTPAQELKIKNLFDRAKMLKENVAKLKNENLSENEGQNILHACASIYGEASGICNQLRAEVGE